MLCNASPLMALGKLNRQDLIAGLFGQVQIPHGVYDEVVPQGLTRFETGAQAVSAGNRSG